MGGFSGIQFYEIGKNKESVAGSAKEGIKRKDNSAEWQTLMCLAFGPKNCNIFQIVLRDKSQTRS